MTEISPVRPRRDKPHFNYRYLIIPLLIMVGLWLAALLHLTGGGDGLMAFFLAYSGIFVGAGIGVYIALPPTRRPVGRRLIMLMLGSLLLVTALFSDHGNMQIEGLFLGVLSGSFNYIILHYALAKIAGPLVFGRIWCGWACWFGMVFDYLPYPASRFRIPGRWGWLRYIHFFTALLLILLLWIFGYRDGAFGLTGLVWFVAGLLIYYGVGIGLALMLKDNRAFCKYVCPIAVLQKAGSRYALLKVAGTAATCDSCNVCVEQCPMNIRIPDYILKGERVLSTECTLCQTCINICPQDALQLSIALDAGGKECIDFEPPKYRR